MTKPTLRRSQLEALLSCTAYESDNSEAAVFGTYCHALIADWLRHRAHTGPSAQLRPALDPSRWEEADALFARWTATHAEIDEPIFCEDTFTVETEHAIFTGTPDAVFDVDDTALLVTDWKTGWQIGEASFQLKFYAALLAHKHELVEWYHGRVDHIRLSDGVVEYGPWHRDELRAWLADLSERVPALLAEQTPTGGAACQYCRRRMHCADSIAPARDVPADEEQAAAMVAELVRLEAARDARTAALKQWFAERDPAVVGGLEVGFLASRSETFKPTADPLTIASWLDETGRSGAAVLAVKGAAIGKVLASELVEAGLGRMERGEPSFRVRKA